MEEVHISFRNIQSHENTSFVLKPGLNFIMAKNNNVGKSTIFNVLSVIASAPKNTASALLDLLRVGTTLGSATFVFGEHKVIAWISKSSNMATQLFFEHSIGSDGTTRSVACPYELLEALGIAVDKSGVPINFNDADSVQLIARSSNEADTILTHIMQDSRVETVKSNITYLAKELIADSRHYTAQLESSERTLNSMSYNYSVDNFFDELEFMEHLCSVVDTKFGEIELFDTKKNFEGFEVVSHAVSVCMVLDGAQILNADKVETHLEDFDVLRCAVDVLRILDGFCLDSIVNRKIEISDEELNLALAVKNTLPKILDVLRCVEDIYYGNKKIRDMEEEREVLRQQIIANSEEVICPVRGRVLYNNEKCLPYLD